MIISLYIGMTKRKNRDTTNCWWVCGQNNHSHIDAVMLNRTVTLENILAHSLKLTMQFLFNRSNCIPAKWKLCSHKILYTNVYGSINYNNQKRKQPRCMSLGEGLNKLWYICTWPGGGGWAKLILWVGKTQSLSLYYYYLFTNYCIIYVPYMSYYYCYYFVYLWFIS